MYRYRQVTQLLVLLLISCAVDSAYGAPTLAVLGDSYSDEYSNYPPHRSQARNRVELLAEARGLNFGAWSSSWDRPRYTGYEFNWAHEGDTSLSMLRSQLPGLVLQLQTHQLDAVVVFVGANDFFRGASSKRGSRRVSRQVLARLREVVRRIREIDSGVAIILTTLPNLKYLPAVRSATKHEIVTVRELQELERALVFFNSRLRRVNGKQGVVIADVAKMAGPLLRSQRAKFAAHTIYTRSPSDEPNHFFLADGIHAGTVAQGLLANEFVAAIKRASPESEVTFLSEAEIWKVATEAWEEDRATLPNRQESVISRDLLGAPLVPFKSTIL